MMFLKRKVITMIGPFVRWRGKRRGKKLRDVKLKEAGVFIKAHAFFEVRPGTQQGQIVVGLLGDNDAWCFATMNSSDVQKMSAALMEELWADSMRGELPEGVVSDE